MRKKINTILLDDEPGSLITLSGLLSRHCPQVNVTHTFQNPKEALKHLKKAPPDLLMIDIEMPFINAFHLLDQLKPVSFEIIFVTAFNNYALRAFKYAAVDYLLKPVNLDELVESIARVSSRMGKQQKPDTSIDQVIEVMQTIPTGSVIIPMPTLSGIKLESSGNIILLEAQGSYTIIEMINGKKELISRTLKDFEELLPEKDFCRIHHSYVINLNHVKEYLYGRGGSVLMSNGSQIEVSVRKRADFLARYKST